MADRRPKTWEWRELYKYDLRVRFGARCPLCREEVVCSMYDTAFALDSRAFTTQARAAGNKHLAEKHPLPPPEPEGWWPCTE